MKRSRSPSPEAFNSHNDFALFHPSRKQKVSSSDEDKYVVREKEPFNRIASSYIIREIRLSGKPFSLELRLDKGALRVGILYVELLDLNERLERKSPSIKPLKIKLKNDTQDKHLVHMEASSKDEVAQFLEHLSKNKYLSPSTAKDTLSILSDETETSSLQLNNGTNG